MFEEISASNVSGVAKMGKLPLQGVEKDAEGEEVCVWKLGCEVQAMVGDKVLLGNWRNLCAFRCRRRSE